MAPGHRWFVDICKLASSFAVFGAKAHCQFGNTGELLKRQPQCTGHRAGEFPTSWVITKDNSRHSLCKAGAIFLDLSFQLSAVSVSNIQKQRLCMKHDFCLVVRALLFSDCGWLSSSNLVPFVQTMPHSKVQALPSQRSPPWLCLYGGTWACLHPEAAAHWWKVTGSFTGSWCYGEPRVDVGSEGGDPRPFFLFVCFRYLFIWLCRVFTASSRIFSWGMQALSYSMWDLVPLTRDQTWAPCIGHVES